MFCSCFIQGGGGGSGVGWFVLPMILYQNLQKPLLLLILWGGGVVFLLLLLLQVPGKAINFFDESD